MKKFLLFLAIVAILTSCGASKSVSYYHRPLAIDGCSVSYSVLELNSEMQIIVTVKSNELVFGNNPTIMFKNFKGEVLKLEGIGLQSKSETTGGMLLNNMVIPITELSALAQFPINNNDIPFFESGISKVRLSTVPYVHEKVFSSDVIGSYLYSELQKAMNSKDTF